MTRSIVRVLLGMLLAAAVVAATRVCLNAAQKQPSPEQKKLEYFVGKWKIDAQTKPSAATPGGKASGTEDCEWFANLHVVCKGEGTGATGTYRTMRIISYLPTYKGYSQYAVDSLGFAVLSLGQLQGDTWTFTTELPGIKLRSTMKTSADGYTITSEYAGADGKFTASGTGKASRAK